MSKDKDKPVATRDEKGRFVKGVSGNPAGKPVGTKHHIVQLREATEHALRDYLATPGNQQKAMQAIDRIMNIAITADEKVALGAMKILFDKILPNAKGSGEEEKQSKRPTLIQIVNHTGKTGDPAVTVIEGELDE